jgi:PIN domain nuclease of toxin-antitoxin system
VKLLLDTCTFLWLSSEPERIPAAVLAQLQSPESQLFLSAVSVWEIGTKFRLGKLQLTEAPAALIPSECEKMGAVELPFDQDAALLADRLPPLHRDPFDRMLVCQALADALTIVTPDPQIGQYPVAILW